MTGLARIAAAAQRERLAAVKRRRRGPSYIVAGAYG